MNPRTRSKALALVAVLIAVVIAAVLSLFLAPLRNASSGAPEVSSGDTNGDGRINITDAVYLLDWLFRGGDALAPVECTATPVLPDSRQRRCYDQAGQEIACSSSEFPGQDAFYAIGCDGRDRYSVASGVVSDRCTGLEWQRDASGLASSDWQGALRYAESIVLTADGTWTADPDEIAAHGGVSFDDWRLPSVRELSSILDYERGDPIVVEPFAVDAAGHWTSTSNSLQPAQGWCVHLFDGTIQPISKSAQLKVIVVRGP